MLFPTFVFAVFFIIVFMLHWGTVRWPQVRKYILISASLFFYGFWSWKFACLLLGSALANHAFALAMERQGVTERHRIWLMRLSVIFNLGILGFFKYTKFLTKSIAFPLLRPVIIHFWGIDVWADFVDWLLPLLEKIVLPVGISFFTFQAMSYVLDVYWRKFKPARTWLDFANYLAFFPQLVAGPIVRAQDLVPQMEAMPQATARLDAGRAVTLIIVGLFKKMVLANWLAAHLADPVFAHPAAYSSGDILLGLYGYTLQIYCDFSAYSDIAIGTALLFGYHFPINFNAPYFGVTLQEFWRRWHISLSSWLRDYLYIPLGGSRKGEMRTKVNLLLTFLLGGIWHGAGWTFVLWGLFHGAYLSLERVVRRMFGLPEKPSENTPWWLAVLGRIWILHVVAFSWVLFRSANMETVQEILGGIFQWRGEIVLLSGQACVILLTAYGIQFADGERLRWVWSRLNRMPWYVLAVLVALGLSCVLGLAPSGVMPFIYFDF